MRLKSVPVFVCDSSTDTQDPLFPYRHTLFWHAAKFIVRMAVLDGSFFAQGLSLRILEMLHGEANHNLPLFF